MEDLIGNTPIALVILEIALIPLFIWIGRKIGKVRDTMDKCVNSLDSVTEMLQKLNGSLGIVKEELHEAEVRSEKIDGSLKGVHASLERIERNQ